MLKKSLIAIAVLAIAMPALAGETKIHDPWPTTLEKQTVCTLDVIMDVGYYIHIIDQKTIKVTQDSASTDPYHTYTGCITSAIDTNFAASLEIEVASASAAGGSWSGTITPALVDPTITSITICVTGTGVKIEELTGGDKNVKVANATIKVLPQ